MTATNGSLAYKEQKENNCQSRSGVSIKGGRTDSCVSPTRLEHVESLGEVCSALAHIRGSTQATAGCSRPQPHATRLGGPPSGCSRKPRLGRRSAPAPPR